MQRSQGSCSFALAVLLLAAPLSGVARAHAPQPRNAALMPDGSQVAVALPGFGLLLRSAPSEPFVYACDALLGNQPSDAVAALAYLNDGSLLMGTVDGVRILARDGCPTVGTAGELSDALVIALAAQRGDQQVVYAAVGGDKAGVWRSEDGGHSWLSRGPLAGAELVTALLIDELDPNQLYLSKRTPQGRGQLLFSVDGGTTFRTVEQERALTPLQLKGARTTQLWAVAPSADHVTNRGFDLLHAETLAGPWLAVHKVNYFGGFTIDARGSLWLGDEGGGVYRSDDGGESFADVDPNAATACLVPAGEALFGCTQGTPTEPALASFSTTASSKVVAFADVRQLVDCGAAVDVPRRCAAAWLEWRRDVLMEDVSGAAGASDAGLADASSADAALADAHVTTSGDAASPPLDASTSTPRSDSGCAVRNAATAGASARWLAVWLAALGLLVRRRTAAQREKQSAMEG